MAAEPTAGAGARLAPDATIAAIALIAMVAVPVIEVGARPLLGAGIENASVLVQHLGLLMTMFGAIAAERGGHLGVLGGERHHPALRALAAWVGSLVCAVLAQAAATFVVGERAAAQTLAYGIPVWVVQAAIPIGFAALSVRLAMRAASHGPLRWVSALLVPVSGWWLATMTGAGSALAWPILVLIGAALLAGMPIFAALGALGLWLFWRDGLPLASVVLSHYQITVNPSLPALPLFTLAGLVFARTGAASRLSTLFVALFGTGPLGTVLAAAFMCSAFTAFTGGSGVTILALGGLLVPLLRRSGYPEPRAIGLVTSASALGVLLAPSVPLVLYAVLARVPIVDMFVAGLVPALLMVACLLVVGGFLRGTIGAPSQRSAQRVHLGAAVWSARWELGAPVVALGALMSGLTTPTESAALTAAYALVTQGLVHRELGWTELRRTLADCAQIIGGVMLILGMALALTNWMVDASVPDAAVDWVVAAIPDRHLFLLALCAFLVVAAALMEIYAALVVLVPLLLPVARHYGIDPIHFGIIFLAAMEAGFLFPPAGMNLYFASAMFRRPLREVARACAPAMLSIFLGTLLLAWLPGLSTGLVAWRH